MFREFRLCPDLPLFRTSVADPYNFDKDPDPGKNDMYRERIRIQAKKDSVTDKFEKIS